jgi:hypothetical protein
METLTLKFIDFKKRPPEHGQEICALFANGNVLDARKGVIGFLTKEDGGTLVTFNMRPLPKPIVAWCRVEDAGPLLNYGVS